jgi:hypothetical protein
MAAKKTSTTTTPSKSDFIRSQPTTMPVAEIVEKAKAQGLKFDASLVYKVRHRPGAKGKTKTSATRKALTAMNGASKKPTPSKADFVRSLPSSTPAKQVVAKARAAGVSISETHVYGVRTADKAAKKKKAAKKTTSKPAVRNGGRSSTAVSSAEELLRAVAAEIGLGRAIELLQGERARVHSILRG